ncbi:MAG: high affinity Mn2+ porin [Methyloprofundus sp.]|nr:MAG: high affinity Mn2+ porin [Methyloprofundus sp.]
MLLQNVQGRELNQKNESSQAAELADLKRQLAEFKETVKKMEEHIIHIEENTMRKHPEADEPGFIETALSGLSISGQTTAIYQSSSLNLKPGDLKHADGSNLSESELADYQHPSGSATFSTDLIVEMKLTDNDYFQMDLQFANGPGVDANLQGGAMVNNDVMEDPDHHNEVYIAKAFYERTQPLFGSYKLILDIGKYGVNDFFDIGKDVSDQTTQFLNQAINNNGAFDYVQDLQGHGYTYGVRLGLYHESFGIDVAFFSSDSYLQNINKKHSILAGITWTPEWFPGIKSAYQIYFFDNRGEYARFDDQGNLDSKDPDAINTVNNKDNLDKMGFGISINQSFPYGVNVFAKYGHQDDSRDVRHYQDMDETYMVGFDVHGENWHRENDVFGIAYEIGRLTGNHRKAHEKGYQGLFDRRGAIGVGNYADERVLEMYYKLSLNEYINISFDYQFIDNFYYSKVIGGVHFIGGRFNASF